MFVLPCLYSPGLHGLVQVRPCCPVVGRIGSNSRDIEMGSEVLVLHRSGSSLQDVLSMNSRKASDSNSGVLKRNLLQGAVQEERNSSGKLGEAACSKPIATVNRGLSISIVRYLARESAMLVLGRKENKSAGFSMSRIGRQCASCRGCCRYLRTKA